MKTKEYVALLGCILCTHVTLAQEVQNCGTTNKITVSSELIIRENYTSCNKDVTIASTASNIRIYGTILFNEDNSFRITPTGDQTIRIRAYKLLNEESPITGKPGDRTRIGWRPIFSLKTAESTIKIYPNPTTVALTIESEQPIIHYKIVDTFGINTWEGTPTNNTIDVSTLPVGMYELILQTNTTIITKTFIKN